jgi:LysR family glycine cleavage system transcriptional activator
LTELRAFEAAARHLSFKAAAAELGVTPTAITHQVKLLEIHCRQPLFRRRPRPISLTPSGAALFPVVRDGLRAFAATISAIRDPARGTPLRVTATNAFASRWLVPRLPAFRAAYPDIRLDISGTDAILDLAAGEVDVAIRYARRAPDDGFCVELTRDSFQAVASPKLVGSTPLSPCDLIGFPLIDTSWPPEDADAPTWSHWARVVRSEDGGSLDPSGRIALHFTEELHAIEAAIAGQGIMLCSDVIVGPELLSGILTRVSTTTLPGYGFYIVYRRPNPRRDLIEAFAAWAKSSL